MAVEHYENFPVASWLCPPALRRPIAAIYWFARTADDLADEGDAPVPERLTALRRYRHVLEHVLAGTQPPDHDWPQVFGPLSATIRSHQLPAQPLLDLLSAFEQDLVQQRWQDRTALLDYCSRSANPIGRLLLHLHGCNEEAALLQSDAICSSLQLINFWQDLSVDLPRGRLYLPLSDLEHFGLTVTELLTTPKDSPQTQALIQDLTQWARRLMLEGAPLVHRVPGRFGWELRMVVQGGLRILDKIDQTRGATLRWRPTLSRRDVPRMLVRAGRM